MNGSATSTGCRPPSWLGLRLHLADGTFPLTAQTWRSGQPAAPEAALHWEHPNLWSWRELLDGHAHSFLAFFVADPTDAPVDDHDAAFRRQLANPQPLG